MTRVSLPHGRFLFALLASAALIPAMAAAQAPAAAPDGKPDDGEVVVSGRRISQVSQAIGED